MREIKFRATFKLLKTVYEVSEIMWSNHTVCLVNRRKAFRVESLDDVELLQFTGLHDKNGTEIYEGDIIRVKSGSSTATVHQVVFRHARFEASSNDLYGFLLPDDIHKRVKTAVIGNIYENPELLK
jgi:uncharacterized phage protein (TIGR01671 family)